MESRPREIKIWTVLQTSLASLDLVTLSYILSDMLLSRVADPPTPGYAPVGPYMILSILFLVLVLGFILGIAISFGLWAGKGWARTWGTVYSISSLLFGLLLIYINVNMRLSGLPTYPFEDTLLIIGIVYVLVSLPSIYFVTRPRVQDFFVCALAEEEKRMKEDT